MKRSRTETKAPKRQPPAKRPKVDRDAKIAQLTEENKKLRAELDKELAKDKTSKVWWVIRNQGDGSELDMTPYGDYESANHAFVQMCRDSHQEKWDFDIQLVSPPAHVFTVGAPFSSFNARSFNGVHDEDVPTCECSECESESEESEDSEDSDE